MVIALVCINLKRWRKTLKRNKRIYQADSLFNVFLSCYCCVFLCFESVLIYCCIRLLLSSLFKSFRGFFLLKETSHAKRRRLTESFDEKEERNLSDSSRLLTQGNELVLPVSEGESVINSCSPNESSITLHPRS